MDSQCQAFDNFISFRWSSLILTPITFCFIYWSLCDNRLTRNSSQILFLSSSLSYSFVKQFPQCNFLSLERFEAAAEFRCFDILNFPRACSLRASVGKYIRRSSGCSEVLENNILRSNFVYYSKFYYMCCNLVWDVIRVRSRENGTVP